MSRCYDVIVVGAGVFGAWTAHHLRRAGLEVLLLDAHGPGDLRASSAGETRIIRMGYGSEEIYTRSASRSLPQWRALAAETGEPLFHETGVLWLGHGDDALTRSTLASLERVGIAHEALSGAEIQKRYPVLRLEPEVWGILEPGSGVLLARRAVRALVRLAVARGVEYRTLAARPPAPDGPFPGVVTLEGETLRAAHYVFACGPWLPKLFPDLLAERVLPTRQEVAFFGPPPGEERFAAPALPAWIDFGREAYGIPSLDGRGFKIAFDRHGPAFDPDSGDRRVSAEAVAALRGLLSLRFPALAGAPLLEARVCQYENTATGDFLVDRHPRWPELWLLGGGSGHGFKHGPAVGEHLTARILGRGEPEPRYGLVPKPARHRRSIF